MVGAVGNPEKSETQISPRVRILAGLGLAMIAQMGRDVRSPIYWGAWFLALLVLLAMEFTVGVFRPHTTLDHPPTGSEPLGITRTIIAIITLALFALLFMPVPMSE